MIASSLPWRFKTFNVIDSNIECCVEGGKFLLHLSFIQCYDILFKNQDVRALDVNKMSIMAANSLFSF